MPAAIPESIKVKVIEMWLQGLSRDANAKANYISTGAVSNIVKEFEDRIGRDVTLREEGLDSKGYSWAA